MSNHTTVFIIINIDIDDQLVLLGVYPSLEDAIRQVEYLLDTSTDVYNAYYLVDEWAIGGRKIGTVYEATYGNTTDKVNSSSVSLP